MPECDISINGLISHMHVCIDVHDCDSSALALCVVHSTAHTHTHTLSLSHTHTHMYAHSQTHTRSLMPTGMATSQLVKLEIS